MVSKKVSVTVLNEISGLVTQSLLTSDWIVEPGYSSGGYILGCSPSDTKLGLDLICFVIQSSVLRHGKNWMTTKRDTQTPMGFSWFQVSFNGFS